jgi:hypothetical protein
MPVFVPKEAFDLWLDCANVEADVAAALIRPADDALLEAYEIPPAVNRVANDSAALLEPSSAVPATPQSPSAATPAKGAKAKKPKASDDQASLF